MMLLQIIFSLIFFAFSNGEETGKIQIEISDIKNDKGQIGILVWQEKDGYPDDFNAAGLRLVFAREKPLQT